LGAPVPTPFTDEGQIWCARADPRSTLAGQISSECVHCVSFRWPKTIILGKFGHFGGLLYGIRLPTKFRLDRFILSSSGGKKSSIMAYRKSYTGFRFSYTGL